MDNINDSVVNRLKSIVIDKRINFNATNLGSFDYKLLIKDYSQIDNAKKTSLYNDIVNTYKKLNRSKHFNMAIDEEKREDSSYVYTYIKNELLKIYPDTYLITDVLVEYQYNEVNSKFKDTLWFTFGDIILENLRRSINKSLNEGYIQCEVCGKRIKQTANNRKMCGSCFKIKRREYKSKKQREYRKLVDNQKKYV